MKTIDKILAAVGRKRLEVEVRAWEMKFWFSPITYDDRDRVESYLRSKYGSDENMWPRNEERATMIVFKLEDEDGKPAFDERDITTLMAEVSAADLDALFVKMATAIMGLTEGKVSSPAVPDAASSGDSPSPMPLMSATRT